MDDQLTKRISAFLSKQTTARGSDRFGEYAIATTRGLVREQNQDAALILQARYASSPQRDFNLAVVCDGLGGMRQGAEASVLALSAFVSRVLRSSRSPVEERLVNAITYANAELFAALHGSGGTTLSAVIVPRSGEPMICHVGDSRIYALGSADTRQLTRDDTLQAALNKQRNSAQEGRDTRLLQFVGMGDDLEAHVFKAEESGAKFYLLTSDGAHDVPESVFNRVIASAKDVSETPDRLIHLSEMLGGLDNATALVVPATLDNRPLRPSEGLELSFLGPTTCFEIWIPQLLDEQRAPAAANLTESKNPTAALDLKAQGEVPEEGSRRNEPAHQKGKKTKRKGSRKKAHTSEKELPLAEPLMIQFPKRGER